SAVNTAAFLQAMEPVLQEGRDILYMGFSSGLSSTFSASVTAVAELQERYPERKIYAFDTLCASLGQGLLVYLAAQKKAAGASIDEVLAYLEETRLNLCHWFTVDDLNHLRRGGRLSATTAVVGTVLNIKPVLHVDDEGRLVNVSKVRGRKKSINALFAEMQERAIDPQGQTVFISHGDCLEDAETLAEMIRAEFGVKDFLINPVGPVIGAHSGPGTLALFFL
ncbi:MAG: DegV family protein, partial [Bacillota bacterium]|nr:DegV family protein [Bacillota bacterium]